MEQIFLQKLLNNLPKDIVLGNALIFEIVIQAHK